MGRPAVMAESEPEVRPVQIQCPTVWRRTTPARCPRSACLGGNPRNVPIRPTVVRRSASSRNSVVWPASRRRIKVVGTRHDAASWAGDNDRARRAALRATATPANDAKQDVLGADEVVPIQAGLFLRQHQNLSRRLGEALKHG